MYKGVRRDMKRGQERFSLKEENALSPILMRNAGSAASLRIASARRAVFPAKSETLPSRRLCIQAEPR